MSEELKLLLQTLGQGAIGVIAFYLYHKFNKELLAQNQKAHEEQHEKQGESRAKSEAFVKEVLTMVIKQQTDYDALVQRAIAAEEDKHMFYRLALQAFEKIGRCQHDTDRSAARDDAPQRSDPEITDGTARHEA